VAASPSSGQWWLAAADRVGGTFRTRRPGSAYSPVGVAADVVTFR
jgi:hypothetical protein